MPRSRLVSSDSGILGLDCRLQPNSLIEQEVSFRNGSVYGLAMIRKPRDDQGRSLATRAFSGSDRRIAPNQCWMSGLDCRQFDGRRVLAG